MGWNPAELIQRHDVPGAQVAALVNGSIEEHATCVLSLRTRIETTTDSVFRIGSITKIWTSTLAQKLVNESVLDLDCPIREYLTDFNLSDAITARHLLTHTSGMTTADQLFPPGEMFSYSNTGSAVLGRLIEVLRDKPFRRPARRARHATSGRRLDDRHLPRHEGRLHPHPGRRPREVAPQHQRVPQDRLMDLRELIEKHDVPGAQVAVLDHGEIHDEAAGVLSLHTQVETTTDSVFKIGSITKIWTATLVQQLVTEGALDLDQPVGHHLPGFRLKDQASDTITARHLLTHTSGIAPNHFTPARSIEEFVAALADEEHLLPPGTTHSYSNSGFVVLGRLVEVLRDKPFHDVLRDELVTPLGLQTVATDVYEAILHRAAVGHVKTTPTTKWAVSYQTAPSGSHLAMSAHDLLAFVRHHLTDPALAALREPQLDAPDFGEGVVGWALAWMRYPGGVLGHTGVSKGQKAFLRVVPEQGLAVAVLTNSTNGVPLAHDVFNAMGIETAPAPVPPANPAPIDDWMCGTYRNPLYDITLDGTSLTYRARTELFPAKPPVEVVRLGDRTIITTGSHEVMSLIGSDEHGRAKYLHNGAAAYRIA